MTPLIQHREVLADVMERMRRAPLTTGFTVLVLAIALSLPTTLLVVTDNLTSLVRGWQSPGNLTIYLEQDTHQALRDRIEERLRSADGVNRVRYVAPERALDQAAQLLELGDALQGLPNNPIPGSFIVSAATGHRTATRMDALADEVGGWQGVDLVQYDRQWVERFQAGVSILRRAAGLTGVLLAAAVVLIIGNTIRLAILNRRQEIEVIKLIGGTDAFVRLPFLYTGLIQGTAAAVVAGLLVAGALGLLNGAVAELAALYGGGFRLSGPGPRHLGYLLAAGAGLGWLGSRLAVGRHLREIEPTP
jgi:cell division transport system permease protein